MTRHLLEQLALIFALESCGPDPDDGRPAEHKIPQPHEDEAMRLSFVSQQIRDRAEALKPRAVRSEPPPPSSTRAA